MLDAERGGGHRLEHRDDGADHRRDDHHHRHARPRPRRRRLARGELEQARARTASADSNATTIAADSVALGADTTGGYAASSTEGGPATTATALAANGGNCSAGTFPLGVDASGAVESCSSSITGNAATATALAANGANCSSGSYPLGVDASGAVESCGSTISGNAATATALAANPADCSANQFASSINASGTLGCAQPAFSDLSGSATDAQIPDSITISQAANAATLLTKTWASPDPIGSSTPSSGAFTTLSATGAITSTLATATAPFTITSTTPVANLAVIQGGLEGDVAAGRDERFPVPLTGFETSTFPPTAVTLANGASLTWTTPGAGYPTDDVFVRAATALSGNGAGANVVAHRGLGYALPSLRGNAGDGHNQAMRVSAAFARAGYFSVWYRAGTETCCDHALLYVDGGNVVDSHLVDTGWVQYTSALLAAGTHTMDFRYTKDGSASSNGDMLMVDDLTIIDGNDAATLGSKTFASPAAIGSSTPAAGTFTTLVAGSASSLTLGTASSAIGAVLFKGSGNSNTTTLAVPASPGAVTITLPTVARTGLTSNPGASNAFLLISSAGAESTFASAAVGSVMTSGGSGTAPVWNAVQTCNVAAGTTCNITVARSGCTQVCGPGATVGGLKSAAVSGTTLTCTFVSSGNNTCACICP